MAFRALGIIPARGGSKGVPRKNIRRVAGKPLITHTIDAAKASKRLTRFVVSTDDKEIASVARSCDCEVLHRPAELAADDTPMLPVVCHALEAVEADEGKRFDYAVILQPTVPLRTADDIDRALELLVETGADSVISVYQVFDHHPVRMYRLVDGRLVSYAPEPPGRLRQDLSPVYHRNGAIYAFRRELIEKAGTFIGPDTRPLIMPRERSINIDDELDLLLADLVLSRQRGADDPHPEC